MKKLLGVSLIAIITLLGSTSIQAATTTGDAQVAVNTPLAITAVDSVNFGDIAIDGAGTVTIGYMDFGISCTGFRSHLCPPFGTRGRFNVSGKGGETVTISVTEATLANTSDGTTVTFVPSHLSDITLDESGNASFYVGGSIALLGNETGGVFTTDDTNGTTYQATILY